MQQPLTNPLDIDWQFVADHLTADPAALRLKHAHNPAMQATITQIECRQRFGKKINHTLETFPQFSFPDTLAGEQATSDALAAFHATLIAPGQNITDLTAGLGIDICHLAPNAINATAIERDPIRARILQYNAAGLHINNLDIITSDSLAILPQLTGDTVFLDPARRAGDGSRTFSITDCQPDATQIIAALKGKFKHMYLKLSPMLDIAHTINALGPGVTDIYAVGTTRECRELLAIIDLNNPNTHPVNLHAVTLTPDGTSTLHLDTQTPSPQLDTVPAKTLRPGAYILEPYPAVMKIAPARTIAHIYNIGLLHDNTRIYPATQIPPQFSGEAYPITRTIPWASKNIKTLHKQYPQLQITTRNFGMTPQTLRAKLKIKDGGQHRLFALGLPNSARTMVITPSQPANPG